MASKGYDLDTILEKLQRPRGYQKCRIRPHPTEKALYYAEMYTADQTGTRKSWKPLSEVNKFRTFTTPEEAQEALIEARGEPFTDNRPLIVQLQLGIPEEQQWEDVISRAEQQTPGSTEDMIEDAAKRLAEALRELRACKNQTRANRLYEIVIGQSNRLFYLAQYVNREARRLQHTDSSGGYILLHFSIAGKKSKRCIFERVRGILVLFFCNGSMPIFVSP